MKRGSDRNGATQAKQRLGKRERESREQSAYCLIVVLLVYILGGRRWINTLTHRRLTFFFLFLRNTCTFFLKLKPESAGTTEIYRTGTYAGTETRQFRSGKYTGLPVRFGCTGDLYRTSADKFIPYRKKKSVSFSFSPSTGDDLYILDLNSGPWTDFGCCYFIFIFFFFSPLSLSLSVCPSNFLFSLSFSVFQTSQMIFGTPNKFTLHLACFKNPSN